MKTVLSLVLLTLFSAFAFAQSNFTDHLREDDGHGRVTLHQDSTIESMVNGETPATSTTPAKPVRDSLSTTTHTPASVRVHSSGYRIQVYAGGNTREAKQQAQAMARRVKAYFGSISVYTHFLKPRWVCRCGDFKSREEAEDVLRQMRATGKFPEATLVKTQVLAK